LRKAKIFLFDHITTQIVVFKNMSENLSKNTDAKINVDWLEVVQKQVASLRFGVVQITVHDSRVVQVETTERLRFDKPQ
jgi:hypothetical protein